MPPPPPLQPVKILDGVEKLEGGTKLIVLKPDYQGPPATPVITPIYHSSNYYAKTCSDFAEQCETGYAYRRMDTPNHQELAVIINQMEGNGAGTLLFPSGMAALTSPLMALLRPGDHIVAQNPLYSRMHGIFTEYLPSYNIEVTFISTGSSIMEYRSVTKRNTKLYYGETLCNPMMIALDIEKLGKLGREMNITTMVDASFSTPINQQPLRYGVDIVAHSCTKYMGGHSDLLTGCATFSNLAQYDKVRSWQIYMGACMTSHDAVLLLRSLRTLHIRMQRHNVNAMKVAEYLEGHVLVREVNYPGLRSHPQHELAKKTMKGYSGMLSLILLNGKLAQSFAENTQLFTLAGSLGGAESLISHPASMTHAYSLMSKEEQQSAGVNEKLVRMSVGIEDIKDILADLKQALDKAADSQ